MNEIERQAGIAVFRDRWEARIVLFDQQLKCDWLTPRERELISREKLTYEIVLNEFIFHLERPPR